MQIFGYDMLIFMLMLIVVVLEYTFVLVGMYYFLYYKPKKLNLTANTYVQQKPEETKKEFKKRIRYDKVPQWSHMLTVIILKENRFVKFLYVNGDTTSFTFDGCLYFIITPHSADNGSKVAVYLEGISLPLSYENVQKERVKRKYFDIDGTLKEAEVSLIKGLKWDGKILYMFANREFARYFTNPDSDIKPIIILIVGIITLVVACIGTGITYLQGGF